MLSHIGVLAVIRGSDEVRPSSLAEEALNSVVLLMIVATSGSGEVPRSASRLLAWLLKDSSGILRDTFTSVLALGSKVQEAKQVLQEQEL